MDLSLASLRDPTARTGEQSGYQWRAVVCLVVAWIVGTCVFESICFGDQPLKQSESASLAPSEVSPLLSQQWRQLETEISVTTSGIDNLIRIEQNQRLRSKLTRMIRNEEAVLALRESTKNLHRLPQDAEVDPDAIAVDPVIASMHVAREDVADAYRKLDESRSLLSLTQRSTCRQAWDEAKMSSLPGLVRLVAADVDDLMPPVYVRGLSTVPSEIVETQELAEKKTQSPPSVPETLSVAVVAKAAKERRDNVANLTPEPKIIRTQPQIVQARPNRAAAAAEDAALSSHSDMKSMESWEPEMLSDAKAHGGTQSRIHGQRLVHPSPPNDVDVEVPEDDVVIVQPSATIHQVEVEEINKSVSATDSGSPVARVAAKWPFASEPAQEDTPKVSLNVNNTDVRTVFEMLARGYHMNILVAPSVDGTVTANIEGLSAEETLQGILKMCDLKSRNENGLIYIYPGDGLPSDAREVRLFPLDFARADVLDPAVQGLLSPIGNAYVTQMNADDNLRTNETIVVVDTPESIAQIENYILQADRPPRQVMIEAHVLEVTLDDDMMHGVNLNALVSGDLTVGSFGLADPIAARSNPLVFAEVDGSRIDALIDAIETTTDSKTLASPRVMVVNGQNARIQVGQQLGFTVATVTETATIQDIKFLDTGVVLDVTPTISRDNQIMMQVKPEVSDGQINPDTLLPEEETREVETSVLLDNHQGVVIGGLIQETDRTVIQKLPWLGDVRHVGKLFQRREVQRKRSEIIVALVPHIIECGPATERDAVDFDRVNNPLLHGALKRACRPWEPRLPDVVGQERHLDVQRVNRAISR